MKKLIALTFTAVLILPFLSSCGTMMGAKADESERSIDEIIEAPGMKKDDLYIRTNGWFVETFNSPESVIEFQDKEAGRIMGKYVYTYSEGVYTHAVRQTISIDIREERLRISIREPYFKTTSGMGQVYHNAQYRLLDTKKGIVKARDEWNALIDSLVQYLNTDDSW